MPFEDLLERLYGIVNESLTPCGVELREIRIEGGYPVYQMVWASKGVKGKPKNIIFASSTKPDLRFRDAMNNDIEIVSNAGAVLVYDRPFQAEDCFGETFRNGERTKNVCPASKPRSLFTNALGSEDRKGAWRGRIATLPYGLSDAAPKWRQSRDRG
jgi:hypothetical protein